MAFDPNIPVAGTVADANPVRENFNELAKHHIGDSAPPSPQPGYIWLDTTVVNNWRVKLYSQNGANPPAWVTLFENAQADPSAITAFIKLTDVPSSYSGQGGKVVAVKSAEDGLEFVVPTTAAHGLISAFHTASGLTPGHVLTALTPTTFAFQAGAGGITKQTLSFTFQNNGAVLNTGVQEAAFLQVPFDCEIKSVRMYGAPSGSIVVDLWKDTYANYPPTGADSIVASAPPTISGGIKSEDTTLTGWSKTLLAGEGVLPNIDSVSNMTWVKVVLAVEG
jgi:hypothetical protein